MSEKLKFPICNLCGSDIRSMHQTQPEHLQLVHNFTKVRKCRIRTSHYFSSEPLFQ